MQWQHFNPNQIWNHRNLLLKGHPQVIFFCERTLKACSQLKIPKKGGPFLDTNWERVRNDGRTRLKIRPQFSKKLTFAL
jgi:hypothetical protein